MAQKISTGIRVHGTRLVYQQETDRTNPKRRRAIFHCDCGKVVNADVNYVRHLQVTSCGCYKTDVVTQKNTKHSQAPRDNKSGAYRTWQAMHQRVKSNPRYAKITICPSWYSFEEFHKDMGDRPNGLTIERVDNTLGYSKDNCIWATRAVQAQNTSTTVLVTIDGQTNSIQEWCRIKGIGYHVVKQRRARGMSLESAITTPINTTKQGRKQND